MSLIVDIVHAAHYAATLLTFGSMCFLFYIAYPALHDAGRAASDDAGRLVRFAYRLAGWGLVAALLTGALWLIGQAMNVSGLSLRGSLGADILSTVLNQTGFGRVWKIRFVVALLLGALLVIARRRGRGVEWTWACGILAAILAATLAFAGHGVSESGMSRVVQLSADAVHLIAAGAWLGALVPLVHLLTLRASGGQPAWLAVARAATERFSILGITSVAALVVTGLINSWFLVGNVPALVGTNYGRLLIVKLVLFAFMLGLATVNRFRLTPVLTAPGASVDQMTAAFGLLRRNALLETASGLLLLLVLGVLSTSVPGLHDQPIWPFSFVFSWQAAQEDQAIRVAVWSAAALGLLGVALAAYGVRGHRRWMGPLGVAVLAVGIVTPSWLLAVPAYPTSFFHSPVRYGALSIARGEPLYAENCLTCHGPYGYGDGPAAEGLQIKPANLTGQHLFHHGEGTLFWWVSNGIAGTPMPPFKDLLSENQRWDVLNFLHAQADAEQSNTMTAEAPPLRPVTAPDFAFQFGGRTQETLKQQRGRYYVLVVLYTPSGSLDRLRQLADARARLEKAGVRVVAVPLQPNLTALTTASHAALPLIVAEAGPEVIATYSLFRRTPTLEGVPPMPKHLEFLVDRQGYLRYRWNPASEPGWTNLDDFLRLIDKLNKEPPRPPAPEGGAHVH